MSRSVHVPAGIFDSRHYGFAQVAIIPTPFGDAVYVSGQVAWDADRNIVGAGDIARQLEKSLENLALALASVGPVTIQKTMAERNAFTNFGISFSSHFPLTRTTPVPTTFWRTRMRPLGPSPWTATFSILAPWTLRTNWRARRYSSIEICCLLMPCSDLSLRGTVSTRLPWRRLKERWR